MGTNDFKIATDLLNEQTAALSAGRGRSGSGERSMGVQVVSMSENGQMRVLWLPEPPVGQYRFEKSGDTEIDSSFYIEAKNGKWYAICKAPSQLNTQYGKCYCCEIFDKSLFTVEGAANSVVFCETIYPSSGIFHNYRVSEDAVIHIGRAESNDIVVPSMLISKNHALLKRSGDMWHIYDQNSANGVFLNGRKVQESILLPGDRLYMMGLRINIGVGFLSINDNHNDVMIRDGKLRAVLSSDDFRLPAVIPALEEEPLFNRAPRRRIAMDLKPISISAPPMSLNSNGIPLLLRMGGPMVMSTTSLLAGNITSMLSSVLFPVLTQKYTDKQKKEYEERRTKKYTEYLVQKREELQAEHQHETEVLCENYPELSRVLTFPAAGSRLWERRKNDDDFLLLRIGSGEYPMLASRDYPSRGFEIDEDPLVEKMYELAEEKINLENVPVMTSFIEDFVCGVVGVRKLALSFIQRLIMRLSILHSYDEVKILILAEEDDLAQLDFVKFLPHIWNDQRDFRFLATSTNDAYQLSEYLKKEIADDLEKQRDLKVILKNRPYYMVFALSKRIFDSMEILKDIMQSEKNCGVSVVAAIDDLPKECSKLFQMNVSGEHSVIHLKQIEKENDPFRMDVYDPLKAKNSMKAISNTRLKMVTEAYALPKMVTFLEMYGVGMVEHLNPLKRWKENNPVKSLAAPVGVATDGSLFMLDLHEKYQGPHGLVAGMTGSGKSEFIITYILSMAINYHPDEVAFILIDYKGGGLAGAFEDEKRGIHLPHLVGTITNLDGAAIQRSLMSIQSELMRRQRIFNEAKSHTGEGTMDIYSYQKLYRANKVSEPMPHLFIISDEFAELKKQEPEFMDKLISAARIGRSLGVHLILATQKPSGVVDDQIWSNTKFRVCLRVQDRGDSLEMLKRPEAAELKDTGRFYLQVGYNEFFALGQSAWCGAQYEPEYEVVVQKDDELQMIDAVGQITNKIRPVVKRNSTGQKQIVSIVKYLSELAVKENIVAKQLWKKPLETHFGLSELRARYHIPKSDVVESVLGIVDDPAHQAQYPLKLDIQHNRNLLIAGESGSGKTTVLQTLLFDLVENFSSDRIQFYILDFSSRNLSLFGRLPHCGGVLTDEKEESVTQLFGIIREIIEERRKLFAEAEVSSYDAYLEIANLPLIMLVIDNLVRMDEMKNKSDLYDTLEDIMGNGVGYGIRVVYTVSQINTCPIRIRRNSGTKIALRVRDRFVYSDILDQRCRYEPVDTPGRGMCVIEKECYEFQTALAVDITSEKERSREIRKRLVEIGRSPQNAEKARCLETVDEDQTYEAFCGNFEHGRIPLGYHLENMQKIAVPLQQLYCMSLYFGNQAGTAPVLRNLMYAFSREKAQVLVVKRSQGSIFDSDEALKMLVSDRLSAELYPCTLEGIHQVMDRFVAAVQERKVFRNVFCQKNSISNWSDPEMIKLWRKDMRGRTKPLLIFFESIMDLALAVDVQTVGRLGGFLQGGRGYNIYFAAGYYPDDQEKMNRARYPNGEANANEDENSEEYIRRKELRHIWGNLSQEFNAEKFALLFGGQFDKQNILPSLPVQWKKVTNPCSIQNIDKALLHYHKNIYSLTMPCEKPADFMGDIDERDII